MATVDSLDIQIKTSADAADKALNKLVGTIGKISASLGGVNFNNFSVGIKNLSTAMQGLQNVKMPDYNRLAKGIQQIGSINSAQIQQAGVAIKELSGSLRYLDSINVSDNSKQIAELANGIARLGYKSSTQAIDNIPRLSVAMRDLMATLSTAPRVSQNIIDMTNALANLSRTGASSGRASTALAKSLNAYTVSSNRARKSTFSLASAFGKMYATYWLLFRSFGKIGQAIDISSQLTEVQNVVDVTFGDMSSKVEEFTQNSIEQFGLSELSAKKFASTFQAMGSAMNIDSGAISSANAYLNKATDGYIGLSDSMADVSLNLTKLTADMASFYNVEQKDVAEDLQAIFTGQTRPMRQYGIDLTQATLQEWALSQGMNANIESMTQAEKTMLRYQYVLAHTGAAQGDFARTADTWANQIRILKQNFEQLGAVIGGTFINMLKPLVKALNSVMSHIIAFAQTVSNALGKIFGWQFEVGGGGVASDLEDGAGYADDLAGGIGDASDNAKKLKNNLLGIDELNIISPDTDSSGGSSGVGGSGGGLSAGGGQWTEQESMIDSFTSDIDSLEGLGTTIRDALIVAMNGIDWESVYETASGFGSGLAKFLNGLLAYDGDGQTLFGEVGQTLADTLSSIVYAAQGFATDFDFYQFGVNLGEGINEFFRNFDFVATADTFNKLVDGLKEAFTTAIKNTSWEDVISGALDFVNTIELDTLAFAIGALTIKRVGVVKAGAAVVSRVASGIVASLKLFSGITLADIPIMISSIIVSFAPSLGANFASGGLGLIASNIVTALDEEITKALQGTWVGEVIETIGEALAGVAVGGIAGSWLPGIGTIAGAIVGGIVGAIGGIDIDGKSIFKKISEKLFNFDTAKSFFDDASKHFKNAFNENSNGFLEIGENILKGILEGFAGAFSLILEPVYDFFTIIGDKICEVFGIHSPAQEMNFIGENILRGIIVGFTDTIGEFTEAISNWWEKDVKPWFTVEHWNGITQNMKESISQKWGEVVSWWEESGVSKWFEDNVEPFFTEKTWTDGMSGVEKAFKAVFKKAANVAIGVINNLVDAINDIMTFDWAFTNPITGSTSSGAVTLIKLPKIPEFKNGGFPVPASLFWAGENGVPEMLGTVGGRTAVASGVEITGIADAVYSTGQTEASLLNTAISLLQTIADKDTTIELDGRELVSAMDSRRTRNGYAF